MAARFWDVELGRDDDGAAGPSETSPADDGGDETDSGSIVNGAGDGSEAEGENGDWAESVRWIWGGDAGNGEARNVPPCEDADVEAGKNDGWCVGDDGREPFYTVTATQ